jgi:signal transduction histidine kinase
MEQDRPTRPPNGLLARLLARLPLSAGRPRSRAARLALTALVVLGALAGTTIVRGASPIGTYLITILAVVAVAWLVGIVDAVVASVVVLLISDYLWVEPRFTLGVEDPRDYLVFGAFALVAFVVGWIVDSLRRAEATARAQAVALAESHKAIEEMRDAAEAASRAKSTFLAAMSHELRTPLNSILGYTALLYEGVSGPVTEEQRVHLKRVRANATHLLDLINEILGLSRIEAGKESISIETVSLGATLETIEDAARPLVAGKAIEVIVRRPEPSVELETDPLKLRQILLNLVSNAIKFTDRGVVEVWVERDDANAVVHVRDTGSGIAPQDLDRIWDAFWQGRLDQSRRVAGTGLGLTLSRRYARLLGGDLSARSELGRGSVFTLRLPIAAQPQSRAEAA